MSAPYTQLLESCEHLESEDLSSLMEEIQHIIDCREEEEEKEE